MTKKEVLKELKKALKQSNKLVEKNGENTAIHHYYKGIMVSTKFFIEIIENLEEENKK